MLENYVYLHVLVSFRLEGFAGGKFKCACTFSGGDVAKQGI